MDRNPERQRLFASLLILGAGILLFRTVTMIVQGNFGILVLWVSFLLILEMVTDISCIIASIPWWISRDKTKNRLPLRIGAAAAILHAIRVLIFVLGRTGPWVNFDVRPEHRALHDSRWSWGWVWFAAFMSVLGITGVIAIWVVRRRKRNDN
jgi:hypothetical protein